MVRFILKKKNSLEKRVCTPYEALKFTLYQLSQHTTVCVYMQTRARAHDGDFAIHFSFLAELISAYFKFHCHRLLLLILFYSMYTSHYLSEIRCKSVRFSFNLCLFKIILKAFSKVYFFDNLGTDLSMNMYRQ